MTRGKELVAAALAAAGFGLVLGFATGCGGSVQKPYTFETRSRSDATTVAIQALTDEGYPASPTEGNPNRVRSDWKNTGTRYGYAGGRPAQLVRRFIIEMTPGEGPDGKLTVQVKSEALACSEVAIMAGEFRPGRDCNLVEESNPADQRDVDRIGAAIERAFVQR